MEIRLSVCPEITAVSCPSGEARLVGSFGLGRPIRSEDASMRMCIIRRWSGLAFDTQGRSKSRVHYLLQNISRPPANRIRKQRDYPDALIEIHILPAKLAAV